MPRRGPVRAFRDRLKRARATTRQEADSPTRPDEVLIRALRAEDLEGPLFDPPERRLAAEWFARQERGELYVAIAELNGLPVGRRCLDFRLFGAKGIGYCFAATVRPRWRSRGIGSAIDRHIEDVARARGMHALRSQAAKSNEGAVRWHERQGDRRTGERIERYVSPVHGGEVVVDCWTFERQLTP